MIVIQNTELCRHCNGEIPADSSRCMHCRKVLKRSNLAAALLSLLIVPLGFWFKGRWAIGTAWLMVAIIVSGLTFEYGTLIVILVATMHAFFVETK